MEDNRPVGQIEDKLHARSNSRIEAYLGEFVYGGIDGCVTTFAVVSGSVGAGLDSTVIIILGFANLFADGFSMSIGAFLSAKSERDKYQKHQRIEYWEVKHTPESEKEEVREIYRRKGFSGEILEEIVGTITSDHERWVGEMMKNELEMIQDERKPFMIGLSTYVSFILIGLIPLLAYVWDRFDELPYDPFVISSVLTALGFIIIGAMKSHVTETSMTRGIAETLFLGAIAALVSYYVGDFLEHLVGL